MDGGNSGPCALDAASSGLLALWRRRPGAALNREVLNAAARPLPRGELGHEREGTPGRFANQILASGTMTRSTMGRRPLAGGLTAATPFSWKRARRVTVASWRRGDRDSGAVPLSDDVSTFRGEGVGARGRCLSVGQRVSLLGDDSEGVRDHGRSLEVRRAEEEVGTLARNSSSRSSTLLARRYAKMPETTAILDRDDRLRLSRAR